MILLAESNFVLELAFQQEQSEDAQRLVELAERRSLELMIPACCFSEPYQTLIRRQRDRKALSRSVEEELRQLSRSKAFADQVSTSKDLVRVLTVGDDVEFRGLEGTIDRLTSVCTVCSLTKDVIRAAQAIQGKFNLDPHDALVFASLDVSMRERSHEPKVFINKNSKDFATPQIEEYLSGYSCTLLTNFTDARQVIERALAHETVH